VRRFVFLVIALVGLGALAIPQSHATTPPAPAPIAEAEARDALRHALDHLTGRDGPAVRAFYAAREWRPAWTVLHGPGAGTLTARGARLNTALDNAVLHGIPGSDYAVPADSGPVALEVGLTRAALTYARELRGGRLSPQSRMQRAYPPTLEETRFLLQLAGSADPAAVLRGHAPRNPLYTGLLRALAFYRSVAALGGWPDVGGHNTLELGDRDPAVANLWHRLQISGDFEGQSPYNAFADPHLFTEELDAAVRRFQRRHGLEVDGIVGPQTRAALNVPADQRARQIAVNLERLRWLPDDLGERYVLVDIAGFKVHLFDQGRKALESRIIVGKSYQQTPSFSDIAETVVVNPYWNVPRSITRKEIIPIVAHDPEYMARENMEVLFDWRDGGGRVNWRNLDWQSYAAGRSFPYRIRQRPGPGNALGMVKILFPNQFSVYLHDTPARNLFERRVRTFSHGCMRVEQAVALAAALLHMTPAELQAIIDSGVHRPIPLPEPVPVHVVYLTAWVEPDDAVVTFRPDVYRRDPPLMQQAARLQD